MTDSKGKGLDLSITECSFENLDVAIEAYGTETSIHLDEISAKSLNSLLRAEETGRVTATNIRVDDRPPEQEKAQPARKYFRGWTPMK